MQLKGSVKEENMFHNYETEKITIEPVTRQKTCNNCGRNNRTTHHNYYNVLFG